MENKIALSVRSVKETVARKNYIAGGEQETLDIGKFTLSGATGNCKIEKSEFRNTKAFKLTFTGSGSVTLTQSLGILEAGKYKIAVEASISGRIEVPTFLHPVWIFREQNHLVPEWI
ncbi:MAG: hypothetical protein ACLTX3_03420 [Lachnospiraceae bacterium]